MDEWKRGLRSPKTVDKNIFFFVFSLLTGPVTKYYQVKTPFPLSQVGSARLLLGPLSRETTRHLRNMTNVVLHSWQTFPSTNSSCSDRKWRRRIFFFFFFLAVAQKLQLIAGPSFKGPFLWKCHGVFMTKIYCKLSSCGSPAECFITWTQSWLMWEKNRLQRTNTVLTLSTRRFLVELVVLTSLKSQDWNAAANQYRASHVLFKKKVACCLCMLYSTQHSKKKKFFFGNQS